MDSPPPASATNAPSLADPPPRDADSPPEEVYPPPPVEPEPELDEGNADPTLTQFAFFFALAGMLFLFLQPWAATQWRERDAAVAIQASQSLGDAVEKFIRNRPERVEIVRRNNQLGGDGAQLSALLPALGEWETGDFIFTVDLGLESDGSIGYCIKAQESDGGRYTLLSRHPSQAPGWDGNAQGEFYLQGEFLHAGGNCRSDGGFKRATELEGSRSKIPLPLARWEIQLGAAILLIGLASLTKLGEMALSPLLGLLTALAIFLAAGVVMDGSALLYESFIAWLDQFLAAP
ncbi:MAG: hypothetical protein HQL51_03515 [Magnetococcales bacterium]|nr:hypothetical protein [Magnetococcales bacterium]